MCNFIAEVVYSETVNAIELIIPKASSGGSPSSFISSSPFGRFHQLLNSKAAAYSYCTAALTSPQPLSRMVLETAIVAAVPQVTGNMIACEVTTSALLLTLPLSMYSGLALIYLSAL